MNIAAVPDRLTLDVIDRPAGGVLQAMVQIQRLRRRRGPGMRAVIQLGTARFVERVTPALTLRRMGVLAVWDGSADPEAAWARTLGGLCAGAREHWHVSGEVTRAAFSEPWQGWRPDTEGAEPLSDDEPALILISGDLRARWVPAFLSDNARVVGQLNREPGYLGGVGVASSLLNTTSCSAWRSYADARRYAYAQGRHRDAMRRDRAEEHHRTEWFLRVRPLAERGTLAGAAPFGALLDRRVAA